MQVYDLPYGQQQARTRWGTHASGAAFDRKKTPFLTEQAQAFLAQQTYAVIAGPGPQQELTGQLVMLAPGGVWFPDRETCVFDLDDGSRHVPFVQGLRQAQHLGRPVSLGLFFIDHATRQRLCVQGTAELVADTRPRLLRPFVPRQHLHVRVHVRQAFFHCSKYIRTRIAGLTVPGAQTAEQRWEVEQVLTQQGQHVLSEAMAAFLSQQVLCFLCTRDQQGRCSVNHRGGAPGFLVPLPPTTGTPGGVVILPDYTGNGAFEAIGNLLETRQAALLIPNYVAQVALCLSGPASALDVQVLSADLASRCVGAARIIALCVQQVKVQQGGWSATLAAEQARAQAILTRRLPTVACSRSAEARA